VAVGLDAVGLAASAAAAVDVGRPSGAARFAHSPGQRTSLARIAAAVFGGRPPSSSLSQTVISAGPVSFDQTTPSVTDVSSETERVEARLRPAGNGDLAAEAAIVPPEPRRGMAAARPGGGDGRRRDAPASRHHLPRQPLDPPHHHVMLARLSLAGSSAGSVAAPPGGGRGACAAASLQ
jgi:hypothetical protein